MLFFFYKDLSSPTNKQKQIAFLSVVYLYKDNTEKPWVNTTLGHITVENRQEETG